MTGFDERERAFEAQFAQDADARFRRLARRNKALASWVCGRTGTVGPEAAAYQEAFLTFAMTVGDDAAVAERVADDLAASGAAASPAEVLAEMARLAHAAHQQGRA